MSDLEAIRDRHFEELDRTGGTWRCAADGQVWGEKGCDTAQVLAALDGAETALRAANRVLDRFGLATFIAIEKQAPLDMDRLAAAAQNHETSGIHGSLHCSLACGATLAAEYNRLATPTDSEAARRDAELRKWGVTDEELAR